MEDQIKELAENGWLKSGYAIKDMDSYVEGFMDGMKSKDNPKIIAMKDAILEMFDLIHRGDNIMSSIRANELYEQFIEE